MKCSKTGIGIVGNAVLATQALMISWVCIVAESQYSCSNVLQLHDSA